jgi:hypothetical protein
MTRARVTGAVLFLFIPLVLILYLRQPLGAALSIAAGVAIMIAHRFVARPFLNVWLARRCFWCGRDLDGAGYPAPFASRGATIEARACSEAHAGNLSAFARFVARWFPALWALIVVPVLVFLVLAAAEVAGRTLVAPRGAAWLFKVPIAAGVVGVSFLWPTGRRLTNQPAIGFPPHNLFLLGISNTLWIFRVVGIIWLGQAVWAAASVLR